MASGGEYRRKSSSDLHSSAIENEGNTVSRTRKKLNKVQAEIDRLQYENRETLASSRTREQLAEAEMKLAHLQREKTGTATRDELAEIEAEIALEEEDSSTIVPWSPSKPSSGRDKVNESKEKLNFIKTRKSEISELFESLKCSETVDLCLLIECTQSMQPYIDEVKNNIHRLVANCKATFPHLVIKVAFVGYRDHCDGDNRIVILNFTEEISAFETFVRRVKTNTGGSNAAKDIFGGLEEVGRLEWSAPTRIVFHVANAPCHGRKFHDDRVKDEFPNGDPRGQRAEDLLHKLEELQVKYSFAKLTDITDKMVEVFRSLLKYPEMLQQVTLDSFEDLISAIANSVSYSIRQIESVTMAAVEVFDNGEIRNHHQIRRSQSRSLKEFTLCQVVPNWGEISVEDAFIFRYKLPATMEELHTSLKEENRKSRRIQISAQPFAEATQRIVYYGIDSTFSPSTKVVLKEFKYLAEGLNKLDSYKKQMEIQSVSSFLAQQFNKQKPLGAKDILFTKVAVISLYKRSKPFYYSREPLIEGPYVKYNSNCGFVNKDAYAASLNAFSHWTYQVTEGYLMVVDLQGVQITSPGSGPKFTLTDPALHCKDVTRFSNTNLGKKGMHRFFRTHHCNSICEAMGLKLHDHQPRTTSSTVTKGTIVM